MSSYTSDLATGKSSSTPIPLQIPQPLQTVTEQTTEAPTTASQVDNSAQPGHSFGKIGVHYGQAPAIQPKLTVGPVNDQYEQEADRVAAQVVGQVNSPTTQRQEMSEEEEELQTKPLADGVQRQATPEEEEELQTKLIENSIQRQEVPEEEEEIQTKALVTTVQRQEMPEEEEQLQTKSLADSIQRQETPEEEELQTKPQLQRQADGSTAAPPAVEGAIQQARGSGQALSDATRQPMERAFGADFSRVKVHTDAQADQLNRSIQARAFTTGSDIFFRQGEHNPGTRAGQELLAHELTHVVQQNKGQVGQTQAQSKGTQPQSRTPLVSSGLLGKAFISGSPAGSVIQRLDTMTQVKRGVAQNIYKNQIKGDPPFKPQHGSFGKVSWFKGKGDPYIGGQAQQYDVTIDVTMPDPRQLPKHFFVDAVTDLTQRTNFNPRDTTQHGNFWRHLGAKLEGEGLSEVFIPQGDLSKQGEGTFIAADISARPMVTLSNAAKLRNDIGNAANGIDATVQGRNNLSSAFSVRLSAVSADVTPKQILASLGRFIALVPHAVTRNANPVGNTMADKMKGQTYTVTCTLTYANYLDARKNAKSLATGVAEGKLQSAYGTVTIIPDNTWPATAIRSYKANY